MTGMADPQLPRADEIQYRAVEIDRDQFATRAAGDQRIPVVLATETPVERGFGGEILNMDTRAVDLSRAANGLPLLDSHNLERQVGVVEDVRIGTDRKLRGRLHGGVTNTEAAPIS
jgi:hypothetical protein